MVANVLNRAEDDKHEADWKSRTFNLRGREAFVVKKDGASLSEDEVKRFVKSNLAGYKVPRDVEFIDELPRTSTGKVLKRELKGDGDSED